VVHHHGQGADPDDPATLCARCRIISVILWHPKPHHSLKPLNPHNAPDAWEADALKHFEQGSKEITELQQIDGQPYLRVMRPFVVEPDCLKCHAHQGYKVATSAAGIGTDVLLKAI